jgi:hypothetical protein
MALSNYYKAIEHWRATAGDGFNPGTLTQLDNIEGYIQLETKASGRVQNIDGELQTHTLYTSVDSNLQYGDRLVYNNQSFIVLEPGMPDGVVSIGHHKEVGLRRLNE